MLVFDSASIPVRERHGAITDAIIGATSATFMAPARGADGLHLQLHAWQLGAVEVVDAHCSAHTLRRTGRRGADDEPTYAITCGMKGRGGHHQFDREVPVRPAGVWATDLSEPFVHHVTDTWTTTVKVPERLLGVPPDLTTAALQHLGHSPLAPLFSHHVSEVRRVAGDVNGAAAASLGTATLALARALVASVAGDDRLAREASEDILLQRVRAYVRSNLADGDLGASRIAAAHHVSVRQLYKTCARADLQLEQWIIAERLAGAHEDLARTASSGLPVAAIAHRWGFANASHFARRFRGAYGLSPREWQVLNQPGPRADDD